MTDVDPDEFSRRLATESLDADDATGWFERLYVAAEAGEAAVPWDRGAPHPLLVEWAAGRDARGDGQRALVVGCGLGSDAEYVAGLGYDTVAFDISETAVATARRRTPGTTVEYVATDLLDLPERWRGAFDLVVEIMTVQALPVELHAEATAPVRATVAPGGTLLVIAAIAADEDAAASAEPGPPWPLTRAEIDAFAVDGLHQVRVERPPFPVGAGTHRWRVELRRES